MDIKVRIDREAAFKHGFDTPDTGVVTLTVDPATLSQPERDLIITYLHGGMIQPDSYNRTMHQNEIFVSAPSLDGLLAALHERAASDAAYRAEQIAKRDAQLAKLEAEFRERKVWEGGSRRFEPIWRRYGRNDGELVRNFEARDDVKAWLLELDAANEDYRQEVAARQRERDAARQAAEKAQREAVREAAAVAARKKEEREQWINTYGSARLKAHLVENIPHWGLFADEYLARERPGWVREQDLVGDLCPPRNVPEAAFAMLAEARKSEPQAQLAFYVVSEDPDDDLPAYRGYVAQVQHALHGIGTIVFGLPAEQRPVREDADLADRP